MENKKERVLAYSLAKVISQEELAAVSGGSPQWSSTMTGGGSAGSGQPTQAHVDVRWDL